MATSLGADLHGNNGDFEQNSIIRCYEQFREEGAAMKSDGTNSYII